jgi:hypothetical protein
MTGQEEAVVAYFKDANKIHYLPGRTERAMNNLGKQKWFLENWVLELHGNVTDQCYETGTN